MKNLRELFILGLYILVAQIFFSCQKQEINLSNELSDESVLHRFNVEGDTILVFEKDGEFYLSDDVLLSGNQVAALKQFSALEDSNQTLPRSAVMKDLLTVWPNGTVPYLIESGFPNVQRIHDAITEYNNNTSIRLVVKQPYHSDYVVFRRNASTSNSFLGKIGGGQTINIADGAPYGTVIHEIAHALGFFHEHTREDRDDYVTIDYTHIPGGTSNVNYQKYSSRGILGRDNGPFDFNSIMLYGSEIYVGGVKYNVMTKVSDGSSFQGQRLFLSAGDVFGIYSRYLPVKQQVSTTVIEAYTDCCTDIYEVLRTVAISFFRNPELTIPMDISFNARIRVRYLNETPEGSYYSDEYHTFNTISGGNFTYSSRDYTYMGYPQPGHHVKSIHSIVIDQE